MNKSAIEASFRPINIDLLGDGNNMAFEVYLRRNAFGEVSYVKFAGREEKYQEKLIRLLEEEELEETLYIREDELFEYYNYATQNLRKYVVNSYYSLEQKIEKVSEVSKDIMKQFFDNNASSELLRSSDQVIELMETCLAQKEVGFHALLKVLTKDYYTYTHSVNVGLYCMTYAVKAGMTSTDIRNLGLGEMLHDVGKSKIALSLLNKNGQLTKEEFESIKDHAVVGKRIVEEMECYEGCVVDMVGHYHERFEGKGYPHGSTGKEISPFARICKVMDVYDALSTRRSYKQAMKPLNALLLMKNEMGGHFDPEVFASFIRFMGPQVSKK